jgi:hypothetical protein
MQSQVRDVIEPITGPMMPSNGPLPQPAATNIKGTLPTEAPANANVPRSASIQNPESSEEEEAAPPGTYGHYAPVEPPSNGGAAAPAPGVVSTGDTPEPPAAPPPASVDPDAG